MLDEEKPHNRNMPILREINRYVIDDRSNILIAITGRVGRGKSHTAVLLSYLWSKKNNPEKTVVFTVDELMQKTLEYIKIDGKSLANTNFDEIEDIRKWLKENSDRIEIRPGRCLIFDEAGTGAFVREFFSQDNKNISKVVQLWRFLRMVIFIVIPENLGIAERNLRQFTDVEIRMIRVDRRKKEATAIAWEYYDKSDPDNPKKQRIPGCRYGGKLHIKPLPEAVADEYERISQIHKLAALIELRRGKDKPKKDDGIDEIVKEIQLGEQTFKRESKKGGGEIWDYDLMRAVLRKPLAKLRAATAKIDYKRESGIDPA